MKMRVLVTRSQNPQSEIRNPKFLGLISPRSSLYAPCSLLRALQLRCNRQGYLRLDFLVYEAPGTSHSSESFVTSAILRAKTPLSSFDPLIISSTGSPPWLMSWSVSTSTYSSRALRLMP